MILPRQPRGLIATVDGDTSLAQGWISGQTGKGRAILYYGDAVPGEFYAAFVGERLKKMAHLHPGIRSALRMSKPPGVYWSVLESGKLALLNFSDQEASVRLAEGGTVRIPPYEIAMQP